MLADTGLTEQQWRVLRVLSEFGSTDANTLADRASLLFPSLTRIAATLREKGFVTQERDKRDRRKLLIELTPDGQAIIETHSAAAAQIVEGFKAKLGDGNYELLLDLLAQLDPGQKGDPTDRRP